MHHDHTLATIVSIALSIVHLDFEMHITHEAVLHGVAFVRYAASILSFIAIANSNTAI